MRERDSLPALARKSKKGTQSVSAGKEGLKVDQQLWLAAIERASQQAVRLLKV